MRSLIWCLLGLAVGYRLWSLTGSMVQPAAEIQFDAPVATKTYDARALIGVDAGPDGLPGIALVDDGFNGIVDDAVELGATGSDDRLIVLSEAAYQADPDVLPLVLQRGAWLDASGEPSVDEYGPPSRQFFQGHNDAGVWEVMRQSGGSVVPAN
ncbi:hypothetical protein [Rubripirellula reticaptiva]|uniref:Uncharacterized protein n=1 Tax=Rubripirellula reticaptiva TaxID=2528013 RepID=A0A5C6EG52_9BACT|nr:hypothetical protein [Rubripirellula reticaptiva]TWU47942.1 hypothetical protein Poly59_47860 [Rubripirellula reticaptiva]